MSNKKLIKELIDAAEKAGSIKVSSKTDALSKAFSAHKKQMK